jgi:hypothetical protein
MEKNKGEGDIVPVRLCGIDARLRRSHLVDKVSAAKSLRRANCLLFVAVRLDARAIALAADTADAGIELGTLAILRLLAALTANFRIKL